MLIDKFAKLSSSLRFGTSAALIIIVAITMYNRIISPQANLLFAKQRYESALNDIIKQQNVLNDATESRKIQLQKLNEESVKLQSSLFTSIRAKEFFSDLETIANEEGCSMSSINFSTGKPDTKNKRAKDDSGIITNSARLRVVATYDNIIGLLKRIKKRTQVVLIESLEMEAIDDSYLQIKCDMAITVYVIPEGD